MTIQEELTQLTDLIKSPTFHILPESAQQPTLAKQRELAIKLVNERMQQYINPLIKEYGLEDIFQFGQTEHQETQKPNVVTREDARELKVVFNDGTIFGEEVAIDTFILTLQKIGLDKVAKCQKVRKFAGYDLVGKIERSEAGPKWQRFVDGWWIYTFIDNERKASTLRQIADELEIDITIYLNGREYTKTNFAAGRTDTFGIKVTFPDGEVIHEPQAKFTFIKVLQKIGLKRIYNGNHGIIHSGFKLVGKEKRDKQNNHGEVQYAVDDYYIYTHIDNDMKVTDLKKLNDYFKLNLLIEMDSEDGFVVMQKPKATYDKTTYSLNGGEFLNKRRFALALVRQYVDDNPDATYEDLKEVFVREENERENNTDNNITFDLSWDSDWSNDKEK